MTLKQSFPYILLVATTISYAWTYRRLILAQPTVSLAHRLEKHLDDNRQWTGRALDDFPLITQESQDISLFDILGQEGCSVLLVTSFNQCSTCRDLVIRQWQSVITGRPSARIAIIVSEGKSLSAVAMKENFIAARALDHGITIYGDPLGELISYFDVSLDQTPLCVLVNNATKRIVWVHDAKDPAPEIDEPLISMFREII